MRRLITPNPRPIDSIRGVLSAIQNEVVDGVEFLVGEVEKEIFQRTKFDRNISDLNILTDNMSQIWYGILTPQDYMIVTRGKGTQRIVFDKLTHLYIQNEKLSFEHTPSLTIKPDNKNDYFFVVSGNDFKNLDGNLKASLRSTYQQS